jgi:hypothetical protein
MSVKTQQEKAVIVLETLDQIGIVNMRQAAMMVRLKGNRLALTEISPCGLKDASYVVGKWIKQGLARMCLVQKKMVYDSGRTRHVNAYELTDRGLEVVERLERVAL